MDEWKRAHTDNHRIYAMDNWKRTGAETRSWSRKERKAIGGSARQQLQRSARAEARLERFHAVGLDQKWIGLCHDYSDLFWLDDSRDKALQGIRALVQNLEK